MEHDYTILIKSIYKIIIEEKDTYISIYLFKDNLYTYSLYKNNVLIEKKVITSNEVNKILNNYNYCYINDRSYDLINNEYEDF